MVELEHRLRLPWLVSLPEEGLGCLDHRQCLGMVSLVFPYFIELSLAHVCSG